MQPAFSTPIAQPHIPAWGELSKNSRLGFTSNNPALYLGHNVCNSTTALGLQSSLLLNRVRSFCSGEQYDSDLGLYYLRARYYNPNTGRFLSRDPLDGELRDPKSLHKYLYVGGDPVDMVDPTGKGEIVDTALFYGWIAVRATPVLVAWVGEEVTLAAIPYIATGANMGAAIASAAAAVAVFLDDAAATEFGQGLLKFYACGQLTTMFSDLLFDLDNANLPPETKKMLETQADRALMEACGVAVGMATGGKG